MRRRGVRAAWSSRVVIDFASPAPSAEPFQASELGEATNLPLEHREAPSPLEISVVEPEQVWGISRGLGSQPVERVRLHPRRPIPKQILTNQNCFLVRSGQEAKQPIHSLASQPLGP